MHVGLLQQFLSLPNSAARDFTSVSAAWALSFIRSSLHRQADQ
jgi:hypothetical protein